MTKRQYLCFSFLTCGLAALSTIACSSDTNGDPAIATGGVTGMGTGGVPGVGGGTGTGGGTDTGTGGTTGATGGATGDTGGSTNTGDASFVGPGGYITKGDWTGYAWTGTETDAMYGTTILPATFETLVAGDPLCVTGSVAAQEDYKAVAMLGVNINQASEGVDADTEPVVEVRAPTGTGVEYSLTINSGFDSLRIQIQGAAGYDGGEAWCADIADPVDGVSSGQIPWGDFNTMCWGDDATVYYDGTIPLESAMVIVPGHNTDARPFDFCLNSIGVY